MDFDGIARQFVEQYYTLYNQSPQSRQSLGQIYTPQTLMTLQDNQIVGVEPIIAKICEDALLSHRKVPSHITAQPSLNNTILVMTQGSCYFEGAVDQENQMAFVEFFLIGMNETGFFIVNQIFSMHGF